MTSGPAEHPNRRFDPVKRAWPPGFPHRGRHLRQAIVHGGYRRGCAGDALSDQEIRRCQLRHLHIVQHDQIAIAEQDRADSAVLHKTRLEFGKAG